jgi:predicted nucleic acid-binding protein
MSKLCVVVDTSIAIKWAIKEEDSSIALALLNEWTGKDFLVLAPTLLAYEATNTLHKQIRKGTLPFEDAQRALHEIIFDLVTFAFIDDASLNVRAIQLAQQFGLPATYDAHYLALAENRGCELWTADTRMWNSLQGKLAWVRWLGDYSTSS